MPVLGMQKRADIKIIHYENNVLRDNAIVKNVFSTSEHAFLNVRNEDLHEFKLFHALNKTTLLLSTLSDSFLLNTFQDHYFIYQNN